MLPELKPHLEIFDFLSHDLTIILNRWQKVNSLLLYYLFFCIFSVNRKLTTINAKTIKPKYPKSGYTVPMRSPKPKRLPKKFKMDKENLNETKITDVNVLTVHNNLTMLPKANEKLNRVKFLTDFHQKLETAVTSNTETAGSTLQLGEQLCPNCNSPMVVRRSRYGKLFYGCPKWPSCNGIISID